MHRKEHSNTGAPAPKEKPLKLSEVAARIDAHLKRMEGDPSINIRPDSKRISPFYCAGAFSSGSRVFVRYVSFQGRASLTREKAIAYLAALDAGRDCKHWSVPEASR